MKAQSIAQPRPEGGLIVICPSCNHGIDDHVYMLDHSSCAAWRCSCNWTPNDIAGQLLADQPIAYGVAP